MNLNNLFQGCKGSEQANKCRFRHIEAFIFYFFYSHILAPSKNTASKIVASNRGTITCTVLFVLNRCHL